MGAKRIVLAAASLAAILAIVDRWNALPPLEGRTPSRALTSTADTRLGRGVAPLIAAHPGLSGVHALPNATPDRASLVTLRVEARHLAESGTAPVA